MANRLQSGQQVPMGTVVVVIAVVVVIFGLIGWKVLSPGGAPGYGERVPVDGNKIRQEVKQHGLGGQR